MARQERMVRERVRRDMGIGDSDEDEGEDPADSMPAGWGRKKSAYYKEGDSEVSPNLCKRKDRCSSPTLVDWAY